MNNIDIRSDRKDTSIIAHSPSTNPTSSKLQSSQLEHPHPLIITSITAYLSAHGKVPYEESVSSNFEAPNTSTPLRDATDATELPLRRKPHLDSPPPAQQPQVVGTADPEAFTDPTFHTKSDLEQRSKSTDISNPLFIPVIPVRLQRRPPASHSSYGVETSLGPPPSYTTQRTLSQDRVWKTEPTSRQLQVVEIQTRADGCVPPQIEHVQDHITSLTEHDWESHKSSPETLGTESMPTPQENDAGDIAGDYGFAIYDDEDDQRRTLRAYGVTATDLRSTESSSDDRKSEDLFLNIAKSDGPNKPEGSKRKSRISLPFFHSSRQPQAKVDQHPSSATYSDSPASSAQTQRESYLDKRLSLGQRTITASSAHPLDSSSRPNTRDGIPRSTSRATRSVAGRAFDYAGSRYESQYNANDTPNNITHRASKRTSLGGRSQRLTSEAPGLGPPRANDHNTTESTTSTTAPSTVWDELDDLKSRIRKLELTGKLPPSSAAAMSNLDRPRTATTAATTMSSSPKTRQHTSSLPSAIEGIPSSVHPLLHEALAQAKSTLSAEVYQRLQATSSDALQLSILTSAEQSGTSTVGLTNDRQLRRRAESTCRSLTELVIALTSEPRTTQSPSYRPASRSSAFQGFAGRRLSGDPADVLPLTSRVQSRLDNRRISTHLAPGRADHSSPELPLHTPLSTVQRQASSSGGIARSTTTLRTRRQPTYADGATDDDDGASSIRPVSRARTEIGVGYRRPIRDGPRGYTSQHPMPAQLEVPASQTTPLPTGLGSRLQLRRKYISPSNPNAAQSSSPITSQNDFGRISVIEREDDSAGATPEAARSSPYGGPRRNLGLASRIGSSVGSRLRAVRAERNVSMRDLKSSGSGQRQLYNSSSDQESENRLALETASVA